MNLPLSIPALMLLVSTAVGAADFSKVTELRRSGDYPQAAGLLKNYSSPARYESLPASERMEFLQGVLELAHVKALQNDVPGALALLNWAENLSEPYPRAYSCVKYAEILLDIGEPERARGYLKSFDEVKVANAKSDERGKAIGQGGRSADLGAAWRELAEQAELLKAQAEFVELKEKFGATYANYVKLRRLQKQASKSKPDYESTMALADEIMKSAPDSQFAGAAGYLKGEIMAARLTEDSPIREIEAAKKYLSGYIKKDTLYRGEALMLLGKISLEIEWDAKDAEKHYTAALAHFREARAKRDAVSLYAPLTEELKQQVTPTKKLTTLNEWKRIVYRSEDPLKLYNTAVAPPWYVDEKEKDCLLVLGLLRFATGKTAEAAELWAAAGSLDPESMALKTSGMPCWLSRLSIAAGQKFMVFDSDECRNLTGNERLRTSYGEMLFLEERFDEGAEYWRKVRNGSGKDLTAISMIGEADNLRLSGKDNAEKAAALYRDAAKLQTPLAARAQYNLAWSVLQAAGKNKKDAVAAFEKVAADYPKSKYAEASLFYLAMINMYDDMTAADKYATEYIRNYPHGIYKDRLKIRLEQKRNERKEGEKQ